MSCRCSAFTLEVSGKGFAQFGGRFSVDSLHGLRRISRDTIAAILRAFETLDYNSLGHFTEQACPNATDSAAVATILQDDGKTHQVNRYVNCRAAPAALTQLEARIDSLVGTARWIGSRRNDHYRQPDWQIKD